MQVLISCKTTNLDVYGEAIRKKVAGGLIPASHLERLQEDHAFHQRSRNTLLAALHRQNISVIEVGRGLYWPDLGGVDAVISVGGDGTVLEASHHIGDEQVPLIGVRSSPMSVGYLCGCGYHEIPLMVEWLAKQSFKCQPVQRLQARVYYTEAGGEKMTDPILNDFLYTNANPAATTRYKLTLGEQEEVQKSSGIWVATGAGSTAVISAAGGQAVSLEHLAYQYLVRELYEPGKAKTTRLEKGFFDPDRVLFQIENRCDQAVLALDGHHGTVRLGFGDRVTFERAAPVQLVTRSGLGDSFKL